ncbi:MAG: efflux RND transporter periplasmic adaptor subunit [Anaerolineae bacterium]
MKRAVVIAILLLAVVGAGCTALRRGLGGRPLPIDGGDLEIVTVMRGEITASVAASGQIAPLREQVVTFRTAGRVQEVQVEEGERVRRGQTLARLDAEDFALQVLQAEASLRSAEARLAQVEQGPSADDILLAESELELATLSLEQAQAAFDRVAWVPGVGALPQSLALQQATVEYQRVLARYNLSIDGPSEEDLTIAQAEVDRALAALESTQLQLERADLRAPFDGILAEAFIAEGELVASTTPAFFLIDSSGFQVDVQIDEIDIAQVQGEQRVEITLEALPEMLLSGLVEFIAPRSSDAGGIITYRVRISLDPTDAPLRAGMTATAQLITGQKPDVLVVPNRAVQIDRETGRTFVERLTGDRPELVDIRIGLRDEANSEVLDGLAEGDRLAVRPVSSQALLREAFGGPGS